MKRVGCIFAILMFLGLLGGGVRIIMHSFGWQGPWNVTTTVQLRDDDLLEPNAFYDSVLNCWVCLPRGMRTEVASDSGSLRTVVAAGMETRFVIRLIQLKWSDDVEREVRVMRNGSVPMDAGFRATLLQDGKAIVNGNKVYVLDFRLDRAGDTVHMKTLLAGAPGNKMYVIAAMSPERLWAHYDAGFESALSTFHMGPVDSAAVAALHGAGRPSPAFTPAPAQTDTLAAAPMPAPRRTPPPDDVPFTIKLPVDHPVSAPLGVPAPPLPADSVPVPPAPVEAAAVPPPPIPANPTPDSIADAATRLAHPDWSTRFRSVTWLSRQTPAAADRATVVPALVTLLDDTQETTRTAAAFCLQSWADASTESAITEKIPASTGETRKVLLALAVKIKTPGAAAAVAPLLVDPASRIAARRALLEMGPVAEAAVDELLKSDDAAVRHDACVILETVGTRVSIPLLRPHTRINEKDTSVQAAASLALDKIQARGK